MTSAPTDPPADGGTVVPLRAADALTEVHLDEDKGPSYVDLTSGEAQRRPLIPEHWRTWENAKRHVSLAAARHGHRAAYHGLRSPGVLRQGARVRCVGRHRHGQAADRLVAHPGHDARWSGKPRASGLLNEHLRLHKQGRETRKARGTILALCLAGLAAAVAAMVVFAPVVGAGRWPRSCCSWRSRSAGRPQGKTITTRAELPAAGTAAGPRRHHPGARLARHRADQPGHQERRGDQLPVARPRGRARLAGRGRPALRRHRHADHRAARGSSRRACGARSARCGPRPVTNEHAGRLELMGRPRRHLQGEAAAVAVAAHRRRRRVRPAAVRHRPARPPRRRCP